MLSVLKSPSSCCCWILNVLAEVLLVTNYWLKVVHRRRWESLLVTLKVSQRLQVLEVYKAVQGWAAIGMRSGSTSY